MNHFSVETSTSSFYLTIKETDIQHVVYLGGQKKGCVEILIDKPPSDPRFAAFINASVCKLAHVTYDAKCSIKGDLQPGEGTRNMLRTAFEIIKTRFPHVTHISLDDASYVPCPNSKISLSLAHLSVATAASTWYERYFNAKMKLASNHALYMQIKDAFTKTLNDIPFGIMFKDFVERYPQINTLKSYYNPSKSLNDFFINARSAIGPEEFCNIVSPWLEFFVNSQLGGININTTWIIDIKDATKRELTSMQLTPLKSAPPYIMSGAGNQDTKNIRRPATGHFTFEDL
jgi:hypothetical protein